MSIEERREEAWKEYLRKIDNPETEEELESEEIHRNVFLDGFLAGRADALGKEVGAEELEHQKSYLCQWPTGAWTVCEASIQWTGGPMLIFTPLSNRGRATGDFTKFIGPLRLEG